MTAYLLKFLALFKLIYRWQGVDFDQLRAIVGIKLEMDNRRVLGFRGQQIEDSNAAFIWTIFIYFIFGGFLSIMIAIVPSLVFTYTIYHAYLMVMVIMTLISDFSAVLLDTSDNTIVLPRPISNKTFYAARATHILLYIGIISLALATAPIVVTFFVYGVGVGLVVLTTSFLTIFLSVAFTNGFYLLLMRFTTEERLKNLINYFQIGMAVFITGGYQILPRLFKGTITESLSGEMQWWSLLIPPMWMANAIQMFSDSQYETIGILSIILALTFPVVAWWTINRYLTPYFTQRLADLGIASSNTDVEKDKKRALHTTGNAWASSITKTGLEKAAFNLASFGFSRDRKLKLRIYPALGYMIVLSFIFIFKGKSDGNAWSDYIAELGSSEMHLIPIYTCIFIVIVAAYEIHYTDDYKASWIFQVAPVKNPGHLITGTMKSIFVRFFIPIYTMISFAVLLIWKNNALVDLTFGFCISLLLMLIMGIIAKKHLPLSLQPNARNQGGSIARAIIILLILAGVGGGHYLSAKFDTALWLACPVVLIVSWLLFRQFTKVKWEDIGIA